MTLPDATSSSQALLWNAFRTNPASDENLYLPDTHIVFLPTGAGAAGESQVRDFYKAGGFSHSKKLAVEETVIHRTVGESSAVDEVEVTVKFVSGSGGWLLPSVEPHHLEDLTITFPLVSTSKQKEKGGVMKAFYVQGVWIKGKRSWDFCFVTTKNEGEEEKEKWRS